MPTYTERYISAATRALPERSRADLVAELEASIGDAVAARVKTGEPAEAAERAVLLDLGDPAKLAADYADRPLTLIGPRYFLDWWRLLKLLLWAAPLVVVAVQVAVQVLAGYAVGEIIGSAAVTVVMVIVQVGFWVTFVFALLEWTQPRGRAPLLPWSLDHLPELREPGLGRVDMMASLVFLVLTAGAIAWDRFVGFVRVDGEGVPVLDPALWPGGISVLFLAMAAEAALAIAVYRKGRWTPLLAAVNTVLAVAVAVPVIVLLVGGMLLNPAFTELIAPGEEAARITVAIVIIVTGAVAAYDAFDGWFKVWRDRRQPAVS